MLGRRRHLTGVGNTIYFPLRGTPDGATSAGTAHTLEQLSCQVHSLKKAIVLLMKAFPSLLYVTLTLFHSCWCPPGHHAFLDIGIVISFSDHTHDVLKEHPMPVVLSPTPLVEKAGLYTEREMVSHMHRC